MGRPMRVTDPRFPDGFVWGVATSAYQIEGSLDVGGRGPCIWDAFARRIGAIKDGSDGAVACDHWQRWPQDVALMQQLGVGAYRFSIAWARVFPTGLEAEPVQAGLDTYDRVVDALLEAGIAPWITLYHWDLPQALEDRGGWPDRDVVPRFVAFSEAVARRLGDRVAGWITHNEPWCIAHLGYGIGAHAPGRIHLRDSLAAAHHVLLSHGAAVPVLRELVPRGVPIGITNNVAPPWPASPSAADAREARLFDGHYNRWYLDPLLGRGYPADMLDNYTELELIDPDGPEWLHEGDLEVIAAPIDFLGINYYSRAIVRAREAADNLPRTVPEPPRSACTDIGWEVFPDGLRQILVRLHHDTGGLPIVVTENGAAYHTGPDEGGVIDDVKREDYLREHLRACRAAIAEGVDLRGYFAWSLLDNFEWQEGFTQRFGLVWVDFESQERTPKRSFGWYRRAIAANGVPEDVDAS